MSETTDMRDPAMLERYMQQEARRYRDGLTEMGIKPTQTLMIALTERILEQITDAQVPGPNPVLTEHIGQEVAAAQVDPEPAPGRSMGQDAWRWKWMWKGAAAGIWIWFAWFFSAVLWRPMLAAMGTLIVILYLVSVIRDILEAEGRA